MYAVQGSFWPLLAVHLADLGIGGRGRGWIFATLAIGSLAVPLGAASLSIVHGDAMVPGTDVRGRDGLLVALASALRDAAGGMFVVFLAFWLVVGPSFSLSNSLAMRNLDDPPGEFGWVRLWGTAGWMIAGWVVSLVMAVSGSMHDRAGCIRGDLGGGRAVAGGPSIYCLTLPDTPPLAVGAAGEHALTESLALVRQPDIAVLLVTSFGVYLTAPMVYQVMPGYLEWRGLPRAWISTTMTLGQVTEIAMLAILPWLLRRFGAKATLMLGISAWFDPISQPGAPSAAVVGRRRHRSCTGSGSPVSRWGAQLYIDSRCGEHLRASARRWSWCACRDWGRLLGNRDGRRARRAHVSG